MKEKKGEIKSLFGLREWFTKKLAQKVRSSIKEGGREGRERQSRKWSKKYRWKKYLNCKQTREGDGGSGSMLKEGKGSDQPKKKRFKSSSDVRGVRRE